MNPDRYISYIFRLKPTLFKRSSVNPHITFQFLRSKLDAGGGRDVAAQYAILFTPLVYPIANRLFTLTLYIILERMTKVVYFFLFHIIYL